MNWDKTKVQKFVAFFGENIDLPPPVPVQREHVLASVIGSGKGLSRKSIDVWELRPPGLISLTAVFGGVDVCAEEQISGCSEPWFSQSCYMAVRHGASEPMSATV